MNAEEPNDDYDAQAAEAAREANIEELNAVMPQLQMNAKDEGQQWEIHGALVVRKGDKRIARLDASDTVRDLLNALQQQVTELEGKAARLETASKSVFRTGGVGVDADGTLFFHDERTVLDALVELAEVLALTSPSTIAQEEQR